MAYQYFSTQPKSLSAIWQGYDPFGSDRGREFAYCVAKYRRDQRLSKTIFQNNDHVRNGLEFRRTTPGLDPVLQRVREFENVPGD